MTQPFPRPTTNVSHVVLDSMDRMFAQLIARLDGIDDAEYLWEPGPGAWSVRADAGGMVLADGAGDREVEPAPVTTIAWRTWHLAIDCFDDYTRRFAGNTDDASPVWTLHVDEAIQILQQKWQGYRSTLQDRDWWAELGENWEHWSASSTVDMAMHASNELVHHGAEIALLRDLYPLDLGQSRFAS